MPAAATVLPLRVTLENVTGLSPPVALLALPDQTSLPLSRSMTPTSVHWTYLFSGVDWAALKRTAALFSLTCLVAPQSSPGKGSSHFLPPSTRL